MRVSDRSSKMPRPSCRAFRFRAPILSIFAEDHDSRTDQYIFLLVFRGQRPRHRHYQVDDCRSSRDVETGAALARYAAKDTLGRRATQASAACERSAVIISKPPLAIRRTLSVNAVEKSGPRVSRVQIRMTSCLEDLSPRGDDVQAVPGSEFVGHSDHLDIGDIFRRALTDFMTCVAWACRVWSVIFASPVRLTVQLVWPHTRSTCLP
jgi:hypothetical protein